MTERETLRRQRLERIRSLAEDLGRMRAVLEQREHELNTLMYEIQRDQTF